MMSSPIQLMISMLGLELTQQKLWYVRILDGAVTPYPGKISTSFSGRRDCEVAS